MGFGLLQFKYSLLDMLLLSKQNKKVTILCWVIYVAVSPYSQSTNFSSLSLILCACSWLRRALIFNFQSLRSNYSYFFLVHHQSGFFLGGFVELKWRKRNAETCTSLCGDRSQLPFLTIKIPKPTNFLPIFSARRL